MGKRKYLKLEEMQQIEINNLRVKESQYKIELARYEMQMHQNKIKNLTDELNNKKTTLKNYTEKIKKEFNVKTDKFGYNPDTGEVVYE